MLWTNRGKRWNDPTTRRACAYQSKDGWRRAYIGLSRELEKRGVIKKGQTAHDMPRPTGVHSLVAPAKETRSRDDLVNLVESVLTIEGGPYGAFLKKGDKSYLLAAPTVFKGPFAATRVRGHACGIKHDEHGDGWSLVLKPCHTIDNDGNPVGTADHLHLPVNRSFNIDPDVTDDIDIRPGQVVDALIVCADYLPRGRSNGKHKYGAAVWQVTDSRYETLDRDGNVARMPDDDPAVAAVVPIMRFHQDRPPDCATPLGQLASVLSVTKNRNVGWLRNFIPHKGALDYSGMVGLTDDSIDLDLLEAARVGVAMFDENRDVPDSDVVWDSAMAMSRNSDRALGHKRGEVEADVDAVDGNTSMGADEGLAVAARHFSQVVKSMARKTCPKTHDEPKPSVVWPQGATGPDL